MTAYLATFRCATCHHETKLLGDSPISGRHAPVCCNDRPASMLRCRVIDEGVERVIDIGDAGSPDYRAANDPRVKHAPPRDVKRKTPPDRKPLVRDPRRVRPA